MVNLNIPRLAVWSDHQPKNANSLILRLARLFRVLGIGGVDWLGGGNAATHAESATANTASMAGTDARSLTGTDATTVARTDAAPRTSPIRRRAGRYVRHGIA